MARTIAHGGDCDGTWCEYCGCCMHGEATDGMGCRAADAPSGMRCCGSECDCEGNAGHIKPTKPPAATDEPEDDTPRQLHQETSLFDLAVAVTS